MSRPQIRVETPLGGWPMPWPNVMELAAELPTDQWTLIGGLMVQLHAVHAGVGVTRVTNDVDILLHIETIRGVPRRTADVLEALGYRMQPSIDPRVRTAHRWIRSGQIVDVSAGVDQVDVVDADHAAPRVRERMRGHELVHVEGGTQALRRTMSATLDIGGQSTTLSVPSAFAGVVLKAAAYQVDSRDRERHLYDAATLLACIADPFAEAERMAGSDRKRLRTVAEKMPDNHAAWTALSAQSRRDGQAALRVLLAGDGSSAGHPSIGDRHRRQN